MRQTIKRTLALFGFLFAILLISGQAEAKAQRTIKVGYMGYDGFFEKSASGETTGYGADYLNKIAEYTGDRYVYIKCSWGEVLKMLRDKEIDLACTVRLSREQSKGLVYSTQNLGSSQSVICTRKDNESLYYEDFKALHGKKIGMIRNSANVDEFAKFAHRNNISYQEVLYTNTDVMEQALLQQKVDAVVTDSLDLHSNLKLIGAICSNSFYLASYKGNTFLDDMDEALSMISTQDAQYQTKLYQQYYSSLSNETSLNLTREEAEYIKKAGTIRVGQLPIRYPLSWVNPKNGKLEGVNEDIMNQIAKISGLKFEYVALGLKEKTLDALSANRCDMVAGVLQNEQFLQNPSIILSNPIIESTIAVVTKKGNGFDTSKSYVVAMTKSFQGIQNYISTHYPKFAPTYYDNDQQCLEAIKNGEADIMLQNVYVMNYLLQKPQYEGLAIVPTSFINEKNCIMFPSSTDKVLISILNKSIAAITKEQMDNIIVANTTAKPYQLSLTDVLYKYRYAFVTGGILAIICVGLLVMIMVLRHRNFMKILKKNAQLADAVNQAEDANEAKSQFLSRMSHEIRTPMNAIVGLTNIAKTHLEEPEAMEDYLGKIESSSKVLLNIINDVLDMSAIENSKLKIAKEEFDIKTLLSGISNIYYSQCSQKGIEFTMATNISDEVLIGDTLRVNQILLNLVSNAYKFTPRGGKIRVLVTQTRKQEDKVYLRFTVADSGIGMSDEMKERIFRPFEQEDAVTARKHGGSGLGLSITKNLVELMHGAITVESQKNVGSTFIVDLPFETTGRDAGQTKEGMKKIQTLKTLVVDDDGPAREYTALVLKRMGVNFDVASDGKMALEMIRKQHELGNDYALCFLDWKMPDMSGIEVTQKIREEYDKDTIVIIVSAYDLSEVEEEAKEAGANLFIPKPLFQSTVYNMLMSITGGALQPTEQDVKHYDFTGKRILLAEDNALNTEIVVELLKQVKLDIVTAEDGAKAVETFTTSEAGTFDMIFMDIQMPEMDGYEATRTIRNSKHPQAATIPIIAMTANAFSEDVSAALSAGMNGHVAKPIELKVLYSTLYEYLK